RPAAVGLAFHLDQQRDPAGYEIAQFAERDHAVRARLEREALERRRCHGVEPALSIGQPAERIVVIHHGLAVGAELQVAFDAVAGSDRGGECRRRVLDDAFFGIVQAPVRHRPRDQPIEARHLNGQATSKTPSTSTAASPGSTATPTVVRACRPLSPSTATIRSEAPFMTLGPSRNEGAELMKPPRRTTCLTLSRSPSAALTCASTLIAQARAAFWPSSSEPPSPSLPLTTSLPLASRQIWPDTNSSAPVRTNGM